MSDNVRRTKSGRVLSDDDVDQIAEEVASVDADVMGLKRRRRGRPLAGSAPGQVVAVRMDPALRAQLDAYASAHEVSVSEVIRTAVTQMLTNAEPQRARADQ